MSEGQDDLFIKRVKVEAGAAAIFEGMIKHDAYARLLEKLDKTGVTLPGLMLARHIITEAMAVADGKSSTATYRAASRAGVPLHEVATISCECDSEDAVWMVITMEGAA